MGIRGVYTSLGKPQLVAGAIPGRMGGQFVRPIVSNKIFKQF